jgi:hypothetical protein
MQHFIFIVPLVPSHATAKAFALKKVQNASTIRKIFMSASVAKVTVRITEMQFTAKPIATNI